MCACVIMIVAYIYIYIYIYILYIAIYCKCICMWAHIVLLGIYVCIKMNHSSVHMSYYALISFHDTCLYSCKLLLWLWKDSIR